MSHLSLLFDVEGEAEVDLPLLGRRHGGVQRRAGGHRVHGLQPVRHGEHRGAGGVRARVVQGASDRRELVTLLISAPARPRAALLAFCNKTMINVITYF